MKKIIIGFISGLMAISAFAGNPDRQGESGANELLFNPWARSAGLHSINTASIKGVEAMRLNIAGLSRVLKGELVLANSRVFEGTGLSLTAGGYATKIGGNGTLGISITSLSFGEIPVTVVDQPSGTGGTFRPNFSNIGVGYSYLYANKISVGILFRGISESLPDLNAFGFGIDAGVQYVSGEKDNFRLGISLNNIGSPMKFSGQGLAFQGGNLDPSVAGEEYLLTFYQRAEGFQLPAQLNLGLSYDFYTGDNDYLRVLGNFASNAYSRDEIGAGLEFSYHNLITLRGAYRHVLTEANTLFGRDVYTGPSFGASIMLPKTKGSEQGLGVDYAYRVTNPFRGTHNISVRYAF